MPKLRRSLILLIVLLCAGCATHPVNVLQPAPSQLPQVSRTMKTAGFWISRDPHADQVILSPDEVKEFNNRLRVVLSMTTQMGEYPIEESGKSLREELAKQFNPFPKKTFYFFDGNKPGADFFAKIKEEINLSAIAAKVPVRFGFITHYADQRILPTEELLSAEKEDIDFDELQNNALDVGTPVAILHESQDGQWCYARAEASSGWMKKDLIALSSREEIQAWESEDSFVVVTSPKADIYEDQALTEHYDYAQMGTCFPMRGELASGVVKIRLITRADDGRAVVATGYLKKDDVHDGYLSYTPRHVFEQAFKLLNAPYGWGGMYGEQDCSRFVQQVFATVGIKLPRNSGEQAKSGTVLAKFDEQHERRASARGSIAVLDRGAAAATGHGQVAPDRASLDEKTDGRDKKESLTTKAVPGATLLGMPGHIMLYLGNVDGRPYAIHATWAFRENQDGQEIKKVINKVVVSDLSLGDGSARGSLLKRLRTITAVSR